MVRLHPEQLEYLPAARFRILFRCKYFRSMRNICRDEYQKEAARLDRIGDIVPLLRQMAGIAGFEIIGRIPLRDKATGKEYR